MKFVELGTKALRTVGAIGQGVEPSGNDMTVAFEAANDMINAWAAIKLTVFQNLRQVFDLVANKGGPLNPYTVGIGGDFSIRRPTWISNAALNMLTSTPAFEIPLDILTPEKYAGIPIKDMSSAIAQALFFNGKFDTHGVDVGLGELFLYPVPTMSQPCELVLYYPVPMRGFADQATTDYTFPDGYAEALRYQLAKRLASEFKKELDQETKQLCIDTFAIIQRPNIPIPSLKTDYGVGSSGGGGLYNWRTGQNSTFTGS